MNAANGSREQLTCAVLLAVLVGLGLYFVLHGDLNADEGFYLNAARLIADGRLPYRDFGFTQTPLAPWANIPWLTVFGYDLTGIRLAGLAWTVVGITIGLVVLWRRFGWRTGVLFLAILGGATGALSYLVLGKTYAVASVSVMLGTIAVTRPVPSIGSWALLLFAGAAGAATRLPTVAFFLPAACYHLTITPGWRRRLVVLAAAGLLGALTLWWASGGAWSRFYFWTAGFHAEVMIRPRYLARLTGFLALAPVLWLALIWSVRGAVRSRDRQLGFVLLALGIGIAVNVLSPTVYAEYCVPFIPATALVVASLVGPRIAKLHPNVITGGAIVAVAAGWIAPPKLPMNVLAHAQEAANFLAANTRPDQTVIASMPEIAVAADRPMPAVLAMGKFALTESMDDATATSRLMVTPRTLADLIADPQTGALAFSSAEVWNFAWSLPQVRYVSNEGRTLLFDPVERDYQLAYTNPDYVIFLRKERPDD